jgi:branched-chain amino acid transport system substrate-binding protein
MAGQRGSSPSSCGFGVVGAPLPHLRILALIGLAWSAAGCDRGSQAMVEIGLTQGLGLEDPLVRVAQAALDSLARGRSLRLVVVPAPVGQGAPTSEVGRAAFLVARPGVVAVVGPTSSQAAMETATIYADRGISHIITTGTSRRLAGLGPWSFTLVPDDSVEAAFIAGFVHRRVRPGRVVLVHTTDLYGWGLADAIESALGREGHSVGARIPLGGLPCPADQVPALLKVVLRGGRPDLVILASHLVETECAVRAFGPSTRYILSDGLGATPWPASVRGLELSAVSFWDPGSTRAASRDFRARFESTAGRLPSGEQAVIYDAILAAGRAALEVGPDRKKVRDYLATLGTSRPALPGATGDVVLRGPRGSRLVLLRWTDGHAEQEAPW